MDARESARICCAIIQESNMVVENLDLEEALLYLAVNEREYLDSEDLDDFRTNLPNRNTTPGAGPGMKNEFLRNGKSWSQNRKNNKCPWHHMNNVEDNQENRRTILGLVVKVAIQVLFKSFCYSFGGKLYHQQVGGPIGARITMAVAQIVMKYVWKRCLEIWNKTHWKAIDQEFKNHVKTCTRAMSPEQSELSGPSTGDVWDT